MFKKKCTERMQTEVAINFFVFHSACEMRSSIATSERGRAGLIKLRKSSAVFVCGWLNSSFSRAVMNSLFLANRERRCMALFHHFLSLFFSRNWISQESWTKKALLKKAHIVQNHGLTS
jgi:hypothetical protein